MNIHVQVFRGIILLAKMPRSGMAGQFAKPSAASGRDLGRDSARHARGRARDLESSHCHNSHMCCSPGCLASDPAFPVPTTGPPDVSLHPQGSLSPCPALKPWMPPLPAPHSPQPTFTFPFHALEKEMATHSSVLAWRIPGTVGPGRLWGRTESDTTEVT